MTSAAERRRPGEVGVRWSASRTDSSASEALPRISPWALIAAASMPVMLTTGWLVADALQPPSYSPMRQTVSVLSGHAGTQRWIVTTALYVVGLAYLVTAAGMHDLAVEARNGLRVAGGAAIGVALFPVPVHGTSRPHAVCVVVGALAITVWPVLVARQHSVRQAVGPRLSSASIVISTGLFVWTALETRNGSLLGLAERVSSGLQVSWPLVVAVMVHRARRRQSPEGEGNRSVARVAR